jgi:hypothetical protein
MENLDKRLAAFGDVVLDILETPDWSMCTLQEIADAAFSMGLAGAKEGSFARHPLNVEEVAPGIQIIHIPVEEGKVYCDASCAKEHFEDDGIEGGMLFGSKAFCPACTEQTMPTIKEHAEEWNIKARCPKGMTFYNWVIEMRAGRLHGATEETKP